MRVDCGVVSPARSGAASVRVRFDRVFPGKNKTCRVASRAGRWRSHRARPARRRGDDGISRAEVRVPRDLSRGKVARSNQGRCAPFECRGDVGTSSFATTLSAVIGPSTSERNPRYFDHSRDMIFRQKTGSGGCGAAARDALRTGMGDGAGAKARYVLMSPIASNIPLAALISGRCSAMHRASHVAAATATYPLSAVQALPLPRRARGIAMMQSVTSSGRRGAETHPPCYTHDILSKPPP